MRHAAAEPGERMDATRTLTKNGKKQAEAMSDFLDLISVEIDLIITSDFERGLETASYFDAPDHQTTKALRPDGTPEGAWTAINKIADAYKAENKINEEQDGHIQTLVIGHGPLIHQILQAACFQFEPGDKVFSHGSMVKLQTRGEHKFHWMMTPKLAGKLTGIKVKSNPDQEVVKAAESLAEALSESLDLPHKSTVIGPLVVKMRRAVRKRFKSADTEAFRKGYAAVSQKAYDAGARQAIADLGPIEEAKKKRPIVLPRLPDPKRTAELASQDIDWNDENHSIDRAQMIAEYEVSQAYHDGMQALVNLWKATRGPTEKQWEAQADACPVCEENANYGWIPDEAPFPSGDFEPPQHPHCRCSLTYRPAEDLVPAASQ